MNDEQGFLDAIKANPDDDVSRLVYADWLDERGDVRGEFLRLEHQLAKIPRRLAELRQQIDAEWVAAVCRRQRLVLVSYPPVHKIEVIRLVREITNLGLKEAKDLVETARSTIRDGLTILEAEHIAQRFHEIAIVSIEPDIKIPS
jgi:uncharacterized protein (TIGR02996 family)